jgi:hypothetical protein
MQHDEFDPKSPAAQAVLGMRRRRRLLSLIRSKAGIISCREVVRHGLGCRSTTAAQSMLDSLVQARLGCWLFTRPRANGGRPRRVFVLTPRSKRCGEALQAERLTETLRLTVMGCDHLREMAWDLAELIREHKQADPKMSAEEIDCLLAHFRRSLAPVLSPHHRIAKTPRRWRPQTDL